MPVIERSRRGPRRRGTLKMNPLEALMVRRRVRDGELAADDPLAVAAAELWARLRAEDEARREAELARRGPGWPFLTALVVLVAVLGCSRLPVPLEPSQIPENGDLSTTTPTPAPVETGMLWTVEDLAALPELPAAPFACTRSRAGSLYRQHTGRGWGAACFCDGKRWAVVPFWSPAECLVKGAANA